MSATKQQTIRRALIGLAAGGGAIALIAPAMVSGSALNTVGSGAAELAVARPFTAMLTGANEFPGPGDTDGAGSAAVTVDRATGEVCVDLRVSGIGAAAAAHIHQGAAGVAGPIVVPLTAPNPTSATCVMAGVPLATSIAADPAGFYVNVHTADFSGGAVRGQLAASTVLNGGTQILAEPIRAYDSREGTQGPLLQGETRVISLASGKNGAGQTVMAVPPGATAAMVRLTLDGTVNAGFVKLYSNALTVQPAMSSVNWYETGAIVGADATVAVDAEGKVKVTGGVNQANIIIDVIGYVF